MERFGNFMLSILQEKDRNLCKYEMYMIKKYKFCFLDKLIDC